MVSSITLGTTNVGSDGRVTIGAAGGSGLDTKAIIEALANARKAPADKLQVKVDKNTKVVTQLNTLKTLLTTFQTASNALRNVPGFGKQAQNIFAKSTATLSSSTSTDASNFLSVTAESGAKTSNYSITNIASLAAARKVRTNFFTIPDADSAVVTGSATAGFFKAGTFTLNGASITLSAGASLNDVASAFNRVSEQSGVSASVIKAGENSFTLTLTSTKTGKNADFDINGTNPAVTDSVGGDASVLSSLTFTTNLQVAENAVFDLDGVTVTRQSNAIGDAVAGLTINLKQTTSGETLTVGIKPDTVSAKNGIVDFLDAYNKLRDFLAKQTATGEDGVPKDDSVLYGNSITQSVFQQLSSEVTRSVTGLAGLSNLGILGITFTDADATETDPKVTNIFKIDDATLDAALATKFDQVRKVFEFTYTSSSSKIGLFSRDNALSATAATLNINSSRNTQTVTGSNISVTSRPTSVVAQDIGLNFDASRSNYVFSSPSFQTGTSPTHVTPINATFNFSSARNTYNISAGQTTLLAPANTLSALNLTYNFDAGTNTFNVTNGSDTYAMDATFDGVGYTLNAPVGSSILGLSLYYNSAGAETGTVGVTQTASTFRANVGGTDYNLTATVLPGGGYTLTGGTGTPLEGLSFNYLGTNTSIGETLGITASPSTFRATIGNTNYNLTAVAKMGGGYTVSGPADSPLAGFVFDYNSEVNGSGTVKYTQNADTFKATIGGTDYNLTAEALSTGGYKLTGPTGSPLGGMVLLYSSFDSVNATLGFSQGLGDRLYNTINTLINRSNGQLNTEIDNLTTTNTSVKENISRINDQVESYRKQLVDRYARLEEAISRANTLLQSLTANDNARNNANS